MRPSTARVPSDDESELDHDTVTRTTVVVRLVRVLLGGASFGIGTWGILHPDSLAEVLGLDRPAVRLIAFRDIGSGALIVGSGGPLAYGTRALFDFGDATLLAERRPILAAGAVASGAVGVVMMLGTVRAGRRHRRARRLSTAGERRAKPLPV